MVFIQIFETGNRFEIDSILSSDTIKTVKKKISIGSTLLLPPDWIYIWKLDRDNKEIPLEFQIKTKANESNNPHIDQEYKNGPSIPLNSIQDLSNMPIGPLEKDDVIFISSIFLVFQNFLLRKREDLAGYVLSDEPLPSSISSNKLLEPFLKGYVRCHWPNIVPREVGIILFWAFDNRDEDAKAEEIEELLEKLSKDKRASEILFESEIFMSKLVNKHVKINDKIQLEQLTLAVNTKPSKPLDLFSVFRSFKLDNTVPFMKIKNPKDDENLVNMLKSIRDLPQASIWIKNKPKGLNFKVRSGENKFSDVSMNSIGRFNINCGRAESKVECLKSVQVLIDKINKNNRSDMAITDDGVSISFLNMSIRDERDIKNRDFLNFIFRDKMLKKYYGFSTREAELEEKQRIVNAGTKQAQRLAAQLKGLSKDSVAQITYKNEFTNIERINLKIVKEKGNTVLRIFGLREISHGQEILNRTLAVIREFIRSSGVSGNSTRIIKQQVRSFEPDPKSKNKVLDKLRIIAPNVFTTSSYSVKCGKDKQPLVWTKKEFSNLDKKTFTYELEYKNHYYTCRKGSVPGKKTKYNSNPGLQTFEDFHQVVAVLNLNNEEQIVGDNLSEKAAIKLVNKFKAKNPEFKGQVTIRENKLKGKIWWPCCFKENKETKNAEIKKIIEGSLMPGKLQRGPSEFLITTDKILEPDRISNKLPSVIDRLFKNSDGGSGNFFRYGTILSDSSLLVAVITATNEKYRKMAFKDKGKFIEKTRKSISEKLPMKKFNALNGGEISGKMTLPEYKKIIQSGILNVDLAHDLLTRGFSKNIFIFNIREGNLVCSVSGQITLERDTIFLIENAPNHYEVIFTKSKTKSKTSNRKGNGTFIFSSNDAIAKIVYDLYKLNCPRIVENELKELYQKVKLVAQIQNHKGEIIYGVTSGGIPLPVKASRPLELNIKKLSNVKMNARETHKRLGLLSFSKPEFKPEAQIIVEDRTIAITLKNGSVVPVKASQKIPNFPVETDADFSDDLDFFIKEEKAIGNSQTKFTRKETYSKELLERVRFELSEMFKDNPTAKEKLSKSLNSRDTIKKILEELIVAFDAPGGVREINENEIPQRKTCGSSGAKTKARAKGSCLSDPFCRHRNGTCELSVTGSDKKRIVHTLTSELYNLENKSQILLGTVPFHGKTFIIRPDEVILEGVQSALDFLGKNK